MKKFLFIAAILSALQASAAFPSMMFHTSDGIDHIIGANGLKINYGSTALTARNSDGAELTLPLGNLEWMEFTDSEASASEIAAESREVTVFGIDGLKIGDYASVEAAAELLAKGIYIVRATDGSTRKISLCK